MYNPRAFHISKMLLSLSMYGIFIKHSAIMGVNAVDYFGGMAKFLEFSR